MKKQLVLGVLLTICLIVLSLPAGAGNNGDSAAIKAALAPLDVGITFENDALLRFSNGEEYVLVAPTENHPASPLQVQATLPEGQTVPDLIQLSDGHFLLRLVTLPGGRKTFPVLENVPISLRTGLLPQDFTFPPGFLLPTMWKSLSGNLLTSPQPMVEAPLMQTQTSPVLIWSQNSLEATVWDQNQNKVIQTVSLPCHPHQILGSRDNKSIYIACLDKPGALAYSLENNQSQSLGLNFPVQQMLADWDSHRLYLSYALQRSVTVIDLLHNRTLKNMSLQKPITQMAISTYRKQLYALSDMSAPLPPPKPQKRNWLLPIDLPQKPVIKKPLANYPTLQVFDLHTLHLDKIIGALPDTTLLYIQDEKMLWMVSRSQKVMEGFDLRWEEFSSPIALPEIPVAMASDNGTLYLLMPEANQLARMDVKTLTWQPPIGLKVGIKPVGMIMDGATHLVYISALNDDTLQLVNLSHNEWIGTEQTGFSVTPQLTWKMALDVTPAQRERIKFQNGRVLLQTARSFPEGASPSDAHAPVKTQTPPEQAGPELTP